MKKFLPLLFVIAMGCSSATDVVALVNPFNFLKTGFYPLLIVAELETNLSSIVIDKTKADITKFDVKPYEILPENSLIYVMPTKIYKNHASTFDVFYSRMITNYLIMNNLAKIAKSIDEADYILMVDVQESPDKVNGTNSSTVQVTIVEKSEIPVFYSNVYVTSKSDKNFYYYPSKSARPVKELTLLGFEETFKAALPKAFGNEEI